MFYFPSSYYSRRHPITSSFPHDNVVILSRLYLSNTRTITNSVSSRFRASVRVVFKPSSMAFLHPITFTYRLTTYGVLLIRLIAFASLILCSISPCIVQRQRSMIRRLHCVEFPPTVYTDGDHRINVRGQVLVICTRRLRVSRKNILLFAARAVRATSSSGSCARFQERSSRRVVFPSLEYRLPGIRWSVTYTVFVTIIYRVLTGLPLIILLFNRKPSACLDADGVVRVTLFRFLENIDFQIFFTNVFFFFYKINGKVCFIIIVL